MYAVNVTSPVQLPLVSGCRNSGESQTGRARELKFSENVHPTICVMCHMTHITCHVSRVTCHMSISFTLKKYI